MIGTKYFYFIGYLFFLNYLIIKNFLTKCDIYLYQREVKDEKNSN